MAVSETVTPWLAGNTIKQLIYHLYLKMSAQTCVPVREHFLNSCALTHTPHNLLGGKPISPSRNTSVI